MLRSIQKFPSNAIFLRYLQGSKPGLRAFVSRTKILLDYNLDEKPTKEMQENLEKEMKRSEILESLKKKNGRLWTDEWDLDDVLTSKVDFSTLPEWSTDHVSRISKERVRIYKDKIPTLSAMAQLPLPPSSLPHPGLGQAKAYALHRKRNQFNYIAQKVRALAEPQIAVIQGLQDWDSKQDAVDELFEEIEFALKEREEILGKHPLFGSWVERALEEYLSSVRSKTEAGGASKSAIDSEAVPVFIDCFDTKVDSKAVLVPKILYPLRPNTLQPTRGKMIEEWELSAHKETKRIMLRQCTRQIASAISDEPGKPSRIFVTGRQGVGKSAALLAIVASARKSGSIVLFLPDGDRLRKNGFYIESNQKSPGTFDLPILSQEVCESMISSHGIDLAGYLAENETLKKYFTSEQISKIPDYNGESMSVVNLLKVGVEKSFLAPMCYAVAVDVLMEQDKQPFLIVADECNCYFDAGQYFHGDYDASVKNPIPYNQISLFKPVLNAIALSTSSDESAVSTNPVLMRRGAILVATTESHAVPKRVTKALLENAKGQENIHVIDVPRLSTLEVEHMLSNYECIGVGKLRLDRGETIMNEHEKSYLRVVSGSVAQKLMDATML